MGGAGAPVAVEDGADTPVWLSLLPPSLEDEDAMDNTSNENNNSKKSNNNNSNSNILNGQFFSKRKLRSW